MMIFPRTLFHSSRNVYSTILVSKTFTSLIAVFNALLILILSNLLLPCSVYAIPFPPAVSPGKVSAEPVGPISANRAWTYCFHSTRYTPTSGELTHAQKVFDYKKAWRYGQGSGQKIAIIDTGITPHQRLKNYVAGGDYVLKNTNSVNKHAQWVRAGQPRLNGSWDCDAHGTALAGIIAASPSPNDSFVGIAPQSTIISIRQFSRTIALPEKVTSPHTYIGPEPEKSYGPTLTLARSIVRAVHAGAQIILIPRPECLDAKASSSELSKTLNKLGNSLRYAVHHNVLVIAGGGQTRNSQKSTLNCIANPMISPTVSTQKMWRKSPTAVSPGMFYPDKYILTVAGVDSEGSPLENNINGPWVGISAPGYTEFSLNSDGYSLSSSTAHSKKTLTYTGSDVAAAYVAGIAALVREHFPHLSATQIINRLVYTAHHPGNGNENRNNAVGAGLIDPLAALNDDIPRHYHDLPAHSSVPVTAPDNAAEQAAHHSEHHTLVTAGILVGVLALLGLSIFLVTIPLRQKNKQSQQEPVMHYAPKIVDIEGNTPPQVTQPQPELEKTSD